VQPQTTANLKLQIIFKYEICHYRLKNLNYLLSREKKNQIELSFLFNANSLSEKEKIALLAPAI